MYAAKGAGRNAVAFYDPRMGASVAARTALELELRRAIERGEFEVWYQPRVSVATGQVVAAEGLVRWRHPSRGIVLPGHFIPVCEEMGLVREVGRAVFAEVAAQQVRWAAEGIDLVVSVNLSSREFHHPELVEEMAQTLQQSGCDPRRIQIEITESMLLGEEDRPMQTLQAIEHLGMSIALDDFGTGYSNLAYLQRFPIRTLRIDRTFIQGLGSNRALAELIFELCRLMQLESVAEGVETIEQLEWIRSRGVGQYQGYLVSRALPAEDFVRMLDTWEEEPIAIAANEGAPPQLP